MLWLRLVLPVATAFAGVALIVFGSEAAGVSVIGVAALTVLANAFIRLSLQSERDRDREEAARRYFDEHGRWP
jgi:hypothetical protein